MCYQISPRGCILRSGLLEFNHGSTWIHSGPVNGFDETIPANFTFRYAILLEIGRIFGLFHASLTLLFHISQIRQYLANEIGTAACTLLNALFDLNTEP